MSEKLPLPTRQQALLPYIPFTVNHEKLSILKKHIGGGVAYYIKFAYLCTNLLV